MTTNPEGPPLDVERILETLNRHKVDFLVVGGTAANAYGAIRTTKDFDCMAMRSDDNLARLGDAMKELHARLRVGGLTDAEAQQLPVRLDAKDHEALPELHDINSRRGSDPPTPASR